MDLSNILSVSGKPGLYKIISQSSSKSVIAESLDDGKRFPLFESSRSSSLEDISIFTHNEDMPLKEVLWKIYKAEGGESTIDHKSDNETLKSYFEKIVPEYDKERVYSSDIKKVLMWYNILLKHDLITNPEDEDEKKEEKEEEKEGESQGVPESSKNKKGQKAGPSKTGSNKAKNSK